MKIKYNFIETLLLPLKKKIKSSHKTEIPGINLLPTPPEEKRIIINKKIYLPICISPHDIFYQQFFTFVLKKLRNMNLN